MEVIMRKKVVIMLLMIVISMVMMDGVLTQGGGGVPRELCGIPLGELLVYCIPALLNPDHPRPPSQQCCNDLKKGDSKCLCDAASIVPGFGIDVTLYLSVLTKCGLPSCTPV